MFFGVGRLLASLGVWSLTRPPLEWRPRDNATSFHCSGSGEPAKQELVRSHDQIGHEVKHGRSPQSPKHLRNLQDNGDSED